MSHALKFGLVGALLPLLIVVTLTLLGGALIAIGVPIGFTIIYCLLGVASLISGFLVELLGLSFSTIEGGGSPTLEAQLLALIFVTLLFATVGAFYGYRIGRTLDSRVR